MCFNIIFPFTYRRTQYLLSQRMSILRFFSRMKELAINVLNYLSPAYCMHLNHNSKSLVSWSVVWDQRIDIFAFDSSDAYFCMCYFASYVLVSEAIKIMPRFKVYVALITIIIMNKLQFRSSFNVQNGWFVCQNLQQNFQYDIKVFTLI